MPVPFSPKMMKYIELYKIIEDDFKNNSQIKIHEVPFTFKQRLFGKTKRNLFLFILTYIFTLIKLRFLI